MNRVVWGLGTAILLFQLPCALLAQQRPDFSGTWVMDAERSESYANLGAVTLVIEQTQDVLTIEHKGGAENLVRQFQHNGSENVHENGVRSRAKFDGESLIITTSYPLRTVMGEWWVNSTVIHSLAAGGNEMMSETTVSIEHGYRFIGSTTPGKSKDVFVKLGSESEESPRL